MTELFNGTREQRDMRLRPGCPQRLEQRRGAKHVAHLVVLTDDENPVHRKWIDGGDPAHMHDHMNEAEDQPFHGLFKLMCECAFHWNRMLFGRGVLRIPHQQCLAFR